MSNKMWGGRFASGPDAIKLIEAALGGEQQSAR